MTSHCNNPAHWGTPNNATSRHLLQKEPLQASPPPPLRPRPTPALEGKEFARYGKVPLAKANTTGFKAAESQARDGSFLNTKPRCKRSLYLAPPHCLLLSQNQNLLLLIPFWSRTPQGADELEKVLLPRRSRHPVRLPHRLRAARHQTAQFAFFQVVWEPIKLLECWGTLCSCRGL